MASKASLETALRNECLEFLKDALEKHFECDVLPVSASEVTIPITDAEGNEKFALFKVSIPRGTRDGSGGYIPYDGYSESDAYIREKADKAQERAVKKAMKEAEKGKRTKDEEEE